MPTKNEPHQPITLAKTNIIEIDGQSVDVPVNVMFQLFPYPRVVIESERLPNIVLQKERFNISLRNVRWYPKTRQLAKRESSS